MNTSSRALAVIVSMILLGGGTFGNFNPVHAVLDCDGHPATIVGTSGNDVINGTPGDDVILGLDGDDIINGNGGNDIVCSGNGNDIVTTDSGNDEIHGEGGFDSFNAGDGNNMIDADFGSEGDTVTTGKGNDFILLGDGDNEIDAGDGDNEITTGSGNDLITSGKGNDLINAGAGDNEIDAGDGDNEITTGSGNDLITSGKGNDLINAGAGDNEIDAGDGDNEITTGSGNDLITSGKGNDCINSGMETGDVIDGGSGTNLINTGSCTAILTISINSPSDGDGFAEGALITLDGSSIDPEDGDISNNISWTSDVYGLIGTGNLVSSSILPIGTHIITAEVTDSDGNTVSQTITISVTAGGPCTSSHTTVLFIDCYSSNLGWTQIGTDITVDDPAFPGVAKFNNVIGGGGITETRVFKQIPVTLPDDSWILEFEYSYTDSNIPSHFPLSLTASSLDRHYQLSSDRLDIKHGGSGLNQLQLSASGGALPGAIPISPNTQYYLKLEKLPTELVLNVYSDSARTNPIPNSPFVFPITETDFTNLNYIQHTIGFTSGPARTLTAEVDNIVIYIEESIPPEPPIVGDSKTLICHFPPGNPTNFHEITIDPSALIAHKSHGDKVGFCSDDEEEKLELIKIKEQRKEIRQKNELKEKRNELKEIKKDLNNLKKEFNVNDKQKMKNLIDEIKEVIKKLNENPKYDRELKQIFKNEIKQTKIKIEQEMTTKEKLFKNKIDSKVYSLSKSDNPQRDAKKLGFDFKDGKTKIVIKLSDDNPKIIENLKSFGTVDIKNDKHVQLTIKVSDIPKLNSVNGIDKIRHPFSAVQYYEELSEGVYFINADLVQFAGITGKGIKVAVLDLAFSDNEKISDNVVQVKSFRQGIGYLPIQGNGAEASHGTAVAEIITDVAPDVELYLYSMESDIEFITAVDEAISQKVDIIAMSAGWPNFPTDGKSHITQKIEEAVDNGIVFVVPSGNFANKHWEGNFVDANTNNWHDYAGADEGLSIKVTQERIVEEKPIVAYLMWDVKMGDVVDFEMVLVDPLGQIVDYSANEQITKSDTPFEHIHHIPDIEGTYSIGILYAGEMSDISKRPKASLEIFSINDELEHPVIQSSVTVPADADGAIVVGAVNHLDGVLEPFSSQGPTNNGKLAPHVVGPDGVTTLALGDKPFFGTSATTPYIAGLAALILQTNPEMSPEQILNEIQQNTDSSIFSMEKEFDYSTGYGSASAFFLIEDLGVVG